jgi:hypothetical protein
MGIWVRTYFEVRSGGRRVALQDASTAHEALHDYLRALGCVDAEVVRLGADAAAWRGAVYRAVPTAEPELGATAGARSAVATRL